VQGESTTRIAVAHEVEAADPPGFAWEDQHVVLDGSQVGGATAGTPTVVDFSGIYGLYFASMPEMGVEDLYRCDTVDGEVYENCKMVLDHAEAGENGAGGILMPYVMWVGEGWRIWFIAVSGGEDPVRRMYTARSDDGWTWTDVELEIDVGTMGEEDGANIYDPFVMPEEDGYRLIYAGLADGDPLSGKRLIEAYSTDAENWEGFSVSLSPGCEGSLDAYAVDGPWVKMTDQGPRLYFDGRDVSDTETFHRRILTATAILE
jgi:hypothetical protein